MKYRKYAPGQYSHHLLSNLTKNKPSIEERMLSIDYSTDPFGGHVEFPYFITDISSTLTRFRLFRQMWPFYQVFPLDEIVEMLLSVSAEDTDPGTTEFYFDYTADRIGSMMDQIDTEALHLFYDQLTETLEEEISLKVPAYRYNPNYVFYKWLDPTSLCMCHNPYLRRQFLESLESQRAIG